MSDQQNDILYRIWSNQKQAFWRPAGMGYTQDFDDAGLFSLTESIAICQDANYQPGMMTEVMLPNLSKLDKAINQKSEPGKTIYIVTITTANQGVKVLGWPYDVVEVVSDETQPAGSPMITFDSNEVLMNFGAALDYAKTLGQLGIKATIEISQYSKSGVLGTIDTTQFFEAEESSND